VLVHIFLSRSLSELVRQAQLRVKPRAVPQEFNPRRRSLVRMLDELRIVIVHRTLGAGHLRGL